MIGRPSVLVRLFIHLSSINRTHVLSLSGLLPATLFSDALLLALLCISSTIKDLQFVLFSHHSRTDIPRSLHNQRANISTCTGHTDVVWAVDWSPDGKRVVSASQDKRVQVWDETTGNTILSYQGHTAGVLGVAWSPDGKYIVSCGRDATVQVWDATTGNPMFIYRGHTANVWAVSWSHDGRRVASGGRDTTVQIWDSMTGDHVFLYTHHIGTI